MAKHRELTLAESFKSEADRDLDRRYDLIGAINTALMQAGFAMQDLGSSSTSSSVRDRLLTVERNLDIVHLKAKEIREVCRKIDARNERREGGAK